MNTIAPAIKRRRVQLGLTQKDMSDKMHLSEKAWRNIENGVTRLDVERLQEIADLLEMSLMDLINSQESFHIESVNNNDKGQIVFSVQELHIQQTEMAEAERIALNKIIAEKDEQIRLLREEMAAMRTQINELIEKVIKA